MAPMALSPSNRRVALSSPRTSRRASCGVCLAPCSSAAWPTALYPSTAWPTLSGTRLELERRRFTHDRHGHGAAGIRAFPQARPLPHRVRPDLVQGAADAPPPECTPDPSADRRLCRVCARARERRSAPPGVLRLRHHQRVRVLPRWQPLYRPGTACAARIAERQRLITRVERGLLDWRRGLLDRHGIAGACTKRRAHNPGDGCRSDDSRFRESWERLRRI